MKHETKFVLGLMSMMLLWAGLGLVLCYKKDFLGNKQEMYPTIILPGFGRNKDKTSKYVYNKYRIVSIKENGEKQELNPVKLFGPHWMSKMNELIESKRNDTLSIEIFRINQIPHNTKTIQLVKLQLSYLDKVKSADHPVIAEQTRAYYVR